MATSLTLFRPDFCINENVTLLDLYATPVVVRPMDFP